jgi:hypothetical protein
VRRSASAAIFAAVLVAAPVDAQRVLGTALEAGSAAPVPGASVSLLSDDDREIARATSDSVGAFTLRAPRGGTVRVRAHRLGYRTTVSDAFELAAGTTVELRLHLASDAAMLAPVTVVGTPRSDRLVSVGFYERRAYFGERLGEGRFLEREDIERRNPFNVSDIFQDVPGVHVRGGRITMRRGCSPTLVVNGFTVRGGAFNLVPSSILAIEVYSGLAVPGQYALDRGGCGVIMFWTR